MPIDCLPTAVIIPGVMGFVIFVLLYAGVVLPTIWSRHPERRKAAHCTLDMLLKARRGLRRIGR
ncbi:MULTISPECIES: hypothetical protein [unclassified Streptomyces]|uniref:hypothetical protein n=1 Tax=unclassified Streptomyces TaxID=2593676 RepID=UPI001BE7350A|nr:MULTISPECIES: hypothetical protein [unclassified Streptomyces]MBT2403204.1 hypothetical protein [Streptomyces sp. ISL-21]MBT2458536.1 hypothetical protein [Streptomyces sp. ISL-86]MBT2610119.1 hypothetical protein [Streptomyces sp. ISL-87]